MVRKNEEFKTELAEEIKLGMKKAARIN